MLDLSTLALLGQSLPFDLAKVVIFVLIIFVVGIIALLIRCYRKVEQGTALVRTGLGGIRVSFSGIIVVPIIHRAELVDISVKRVEIYRHGPEGLICQDNMRADIKVAFFVRVNNETQNVLEVAQRVGCRRASDERALVDLFDSKFSEALKSVGKQFDFVELYNSRERFREEILKVIGTDLLGFVLEDAAIDYLEQTPVEALNPNNILDAEGIKKITDLTANQQVLANNIQREKEKTITKQNVEAREAILELEKQQAEAEEHQKREVRSITAREEAEANKVIAEERRKQEEARITADEAIQIAEENRMRQVIVAAKSKERTEAVENERVERDRMLEATERERVVTLAQIEKEKSVEVEKRNIQEVIRERVMVERAVVEEQEKIKDTHEFAAADRLKQVTVTKAEMSAQENLVKEVKAAEASRNASEKLAEQQVIEAEAMRAAAEKQTAAKKMLAEAKTAEEAASGLAEAQVLTVKADAIEKHGAAEANVLEKKAVAEARGIEAKAVAVEKQGLAEANVMQQKASAEAQGITEKAEAMKILDTVGKDHEEFKLRLNKDRDIELAAINIQRDIADDQAKIVGEALKTAKIDIVGGEGEFFNKLVSSITAGKAVDRFVGNSRVAADIKNTFFNGNGDPAYFEHRLEEFVDRFGMSTEDVKNLSIAALIAKMMGLTDDEGMLEKLLSLQGAAEQSGVADKLASTFLGGGSGGGGAKKKVKS